MNKYIVRSAFTVKSPTGDQVMRTGEALRLSSLKAASLVSQGQLVDANIGTDLIGRYEERLLILKIKLGYPQTEAEAGARQLLDSLLKRHESLKRMEPPSPDFLREVDEFNRAATGDNPITPIQAETGAGEWARYNCNIGKGCSHGCLYCYAEKMATRFKRVEGAENWREEIDRTVSTVNCRKYDVAIMFPTTHDISPGYLPAYRCHLYNILSAGNMVILVTKPHRESIHAICSEFSIFRDQMIFRFSIGGLDAEALQLWEPYAPPLEERIECLRIAFEQGFMTSVSAEPMLVDGDGAEKLFYTLEPLITEDIWFGKMNNVGGFRKWEDRDIAARAAALSKSYGDKEILQLVSRLAVQKKVQWKDSIKTVIQKNASKEG